MESSRSLVIAAGAVSLAVSLFAIGAAVSSDDSGGGAAAPVATVTDTALPVTIPAAADTTAETAADATTPGEGSGGGGAVTTLTGAAAPAGDPVAIEIADFAFGPGETTVASGTEVVWTNNDGFEHNIVFVNNEPAPPGPTMVEGDTYSVTFTEPGTYSYICGFHPQMTGTIVVEA